MNKYSNILVANINYKTLKTSRESIKIFDGKYSKTYIVVDDVNNPQIKKNSSLIKTMTNLERESLFNISSNNIKLKIRNINLFNSKTELSNTIKKSTFNSKYNPIIYQYPCIKSRKKSYLFKKNNATIKIHKLNMSTIKNNCLTKKKLI